MVREDTLKVYIKSVQNVAETSNHPLNLALQLVRMIAA